MSVSERLLSLPPELHVQILQYLDIDSYQNLTATNNYFRSLRSESLNRGALLYTEFHDPGWFEGRSILPCSTCLKVVDQDECWALHDGVWMFTQKGGLWEARSLCWECTDDQSGEGNRMGSQELDRP